MRGSHETEEDHPAARVHKKNTENTNREFCSSWGGPATPVIFRFQPNLTIEANLLQALSFRAGFFRESLTTASLSFPRLRVFMPLHHVFDNLAKIGDPFSR